MAEKGASKRLRYKYKQNEISERMSLTFDDNNLLRPIINIGGSVFEGEIVLATLYKKNRAHKSLKVVIKNDGLPDGVKRNSSPPNDDKDKMIDFNLVEYLSLTIGLFGLTIKLLTPILRSEQVKVKVNEIKPIEQSQQGESRKFLRVDDTQLNILISKENRFSRREKKLIRKLIDELQKEKPV